METYVMGDPHGANRAVLQVLDRAGFDPAAHRLVVLGDVCDGWPETDRVIDTLLSLSHLTLIKGNHELWSLDWMRGKAVSLSWLESGGMATVDAYARRADRAPPSNIEEVVDLGVTVPPEHVRLLEQAHPYLIERSPTGREVLYVHAGWDAQKEADEQNEETLFWSRDFFDEVMEEGPPLTGFDEVYIGHTPTPWPGPLRKREVWALDQGAGWDGRLTLFHIEDHTFVQSDPVPELYPHQVGRGSAG